MKQAEPLRATGEMKGLYYTLTAEPRGTADTTQTQPLPGDATPQPQRAVSREEVCASPGCAGMSPYSFLLSGLVQSWNLCT